MSRRRLAASTSTSTVLPDERGVQLGLDVALERLQRDDPPRLLVLRHIVGQPLLGQRVRTRANT